VVGRGVADGGQVQRSLPCCLNELWNLLLIAMRLIQIQPEQPQMPASATTVIHRRRKLPVDPSLERTVAVPTLRRHISVIATAVDGFGGCHTGSVFGLGHRRCVRHLVVGVNVVMQSPSFTPAE